MIVVEKAKTTEGKHFESIRNFEHQLWINKQLMDLHEPNIPEDSKIVIDHTIENAYKVFEPKVFQKYYDEDNLGGSINNLNFWLHNTFLQLSKYK